ncbi:MAG: type restriction enzyme [Candidatus Atribacteria bacterium]|nr:type restriction enzyme [Candidatus Atribacteria bacterium]
MDVSLYLSFFKLRSFDAIIDIFHDTLIDTNRGYQFFVD